MSKRDGKMYIAKQLAREIRTSSGVDINIEDDVCAGCVFVFWTKKAAREVYGRNVGLIEIEIRNETP